MKRSTRISILVFTICAAILAFGALWYTRPSAPSYIIEEAKQRQEVPLLEVKEPASRLAPPEIDYDKLAAKIAPQIKASLVNDKDFINAIVDLNKVEISNAVKDYTSSTLVPSMNEKIDNLANELLASINEDLELEVKDIIENKVQTILASIDVKDYSPELIEALDALIVDKVEPEAIVAEDVKKVDDIEDIGKMFEIDDFEEFEDFDDFIDFKEVKAEETEKVEEFEDVVKVVEVAKAEEVVKEPKEPKIVEVTKVAKVDKEEKEEVVEIKRVILSKEELVEQSKLRKQAILSQFGQIISKSLPRELVEEMAKPEVKEVAAPVVKEPKVVKKEVSIIELDPTKLALKSEGHKNALISQLRRILPDKMTQEQIEVFEDKDTDIKVEPVEKDKVVIKEDIPEKKVVAVKDETPIIPIIKEDVVVKKAEVVQEDVTIKEVIADKDEVAVDDELAIKSQEHKDQFIAQLRTILPEKMTEEQMDLFREEEEPFKEDVVSSEGKGAISATVLAQVLDATSATTTEVDDSKEEVKIPTFYPRQPKTLTTQEYNEQRAEIRKKAIEDTLRKLSD